jgi:hypothetical protein
MRTPGLAGNVIECDEASVRRANKRIILKRLAETSPLFGTLLSGASDVRFEYARRD